MVNKEGDALIDQPHRALALVNLPEAEVARTHGKLLVTLRKATAHLELLMGMVLLRGENWGSRTRAMQRTFRLMVTMPGRMLLVLQGQIHRGSSLARSMTSPAMLPVWRWRLSWVHVQVTTNFLPPQPQLLPSPPWLRPHGTLTLNTQTQLLGP